MPAPVMTTTFRDFHNVFAISCNKGSQPGSTWVVGIAIALLIGAASDGCGVEKKNDNGDNGNDGDRRRYEKSKRRR